MTILRSVSAARMVFALATFVLAGRIDPVAARPAPPAPCPAARYLIGGDPILAGTKGLQIGPSVSIDALCGPVAPKKLKATKRGVTQILAKWSQCTGLTGKVTLKGKLPAGCAQLQGTLKAKKFKRTIHATLSRCGDGVVDQPGGEECDDANAVPGDGCEPDCTKTPSTGTLPPTTTPTSTTTTSTSITNPSTSVTSTSQTTTTLSGSSTTLASSTTTHTGSSSTSTTKTTTTSSTTTTTTLPKTVLALAAIANPNPVAPAGLVTYQLTATNRGPANAVQAQLRMTLPTGVFACGTPSDAGQLPTGCAAAHDIVWSLGTLAVDTSRTVQIVVQYRGDVVSGTTLDASARLDDAAFSPEATAHAIVVVQSAGPLSFGLTGDADPVQVGDALEYTLRFGNQSTSALLNTQLAFTLPAVTTVVDASGGAQAGGMITWSLGSLLAGQVGERRVLVHVDDLAPSDPLVRVAQAAITSGSLSAHAAVVTQVHATALGLKLIAQPDPLAPAGRLTYQATVTNQGATDAAQVQLRLTLPTGIFACDTPSDGGTTPDGCVAGQDVLWNLGTLAPATSRSVQLVIQVRGDIPTGAILSTIARVEDGAGARRRVGVSTVVQAPSPLALVIATDGDPVQVGDGLEYVLSYGNRGASALLSVQLALVLPAGETVVDAGGGMVAAGTITWSLGALNAAQAGERRVKVHVDDLAAGDQLVRVARASITSGATAAQAFAVTQVGPALLGLKLIAQPDPLAPAGLLTYHLTVTNRAATDAQQVTARLTLPDGTFACATPSDGGTAPEGCIAGRDVVWDLGAIGAGTSRAVQLVMQIRGDVLAGAVLSTTARVEDAAGSRTRAGTTTTVQTMPPLDLVLTTDADPVQVGDDLEYALRFGNSGVSALLSAQLALVLPAGTTIVDAGGGTASAGTITWALGTLDPAETGERRVRVHVEELAAADPLVRVARAVVSSGAVATRAFTVTQVEATVLGLEMVAQPDPLAPAGLLTYMVVLSNRGSDDSVQAEVRLTLPVGIFACLPASDGATTPDGCIAGRDVFWTLATLAPGTSRTVQLAIQIRADVPAGTILWTTVRVEDAAGSRARTAGSTGVEAAPPLSLAMTTDGDPVQVGADLGYALRFGNRSAGALTGTQLAFVIPPGTSVVDAGGGTVAAGTITWAIGTLNSMAIGERQVSMHVDDLASDEPFVRVARAVMASGNSDVRVGAATQIAPSTLDVAMTATPDPLAPAGLLTYQLTVTNSAAEDSVQVELRMTLPVGIFGCGTLSDGGQLPQGCIADRDVVWNLGTISAGAFRTVQAVIQIRADVPRGTILSTTARVQDAAGSRARTAVTTGVGS